MLVKIDKPHCQGKSEFTPYDIWQKGGLAEHLGGIFPARRLLNTCHLTAGQLILDISCGKGYTACYLAENCQA